jgi:hypothetical protein
MQGKRCKARVSKYAIRLRSYRRLKDESSQCQRKARASGYCYQHDPGVVRIYCSCPHGREFFSPGWAVCEEGEWRMLCCGRTVRNVVW